MSLGLSAGSAILFTPMSPTHLDLGGVSQVRTNAKAGWLTGTGKEAYSINLFSRLARGKWFLQPEAGYQSLLSSPIAYEDDYPNGFGGIITAGREDFHNFRSDQLGLGTLAGCYLGAGEHFYVLAGPSVGFRVGGSDYGTSRTELGNEIRASLNRAPATTRFFVQGGLGYWGVARHLDFELRYLHGLTPLVRSVTFRDQKYALKAQAHMLLLTMAFTYDFRRKVTAATP
ncbi:outer membrane beta-barrel protein [Hymenobacter humi]|uniref:Outer membrane beta-barrel protein n=1 Tax=Hymenobacter humi TaxID=1411620 RepID=A0ABW2U4Q1_9BACT